jgi:hypothetical protein
MKDRCKIAVCRHDIHGFGHPLHGGCDQFLFHGKNALSPAELQCRCRAGFHIFHPPVVFFPELFRRPVCRSSGFFHDGIRFYACCRQNVGYRGFRLRPDIFQNRINSHDIPFLAETLSVPGRIRL